MSIQDDPFLKELQLQCLKDSTEYLHAFRDALPSIAQNPLVAMTTILKSLHSLKGNLQAAGFTSCGEWVHQLESQTVKIEALIKNAGGSIAEADASVLEFLLSDCLSALEGYFADLQTQNDSPSLLENRKTALDVLSGWNLTTAATTATPQSPKQDEPVPQTTLASASETASVTEAVSAEITEVPETSKAPAPVASEETKKVRSELYLVCKNGSRLFGVSIDDVVEIIEHHDFDPLPFDRPGLKGLINLRGEAMPVLNIEDIAPLENESQQFRRSCVVVCNVNGDSFGFCVEEAQQVLPLPASTFQPVEGLHTNRSGSVTHFSLTDDRVILVLDVRKAIAA